MQQAGGHEPLEAHAAGERKVVSVLFADIVGSTEIITSLDPEDANTALLSAINAACERIRHFRGTVSQIMGDGVLAVFGAPMAQEDHALRAGLAALAIHARAERQTHRVRFRVGVSSGEVVAYGSKGGVHPFLRVVGEPVHLAARLQERARPGRTAISRDTRRLLGVRADTSVLGHYQLTSKEIAEVFELRRLNARSAPRRDSIPVGHGLARLIGREREIRALRSNLSTALRAHGRSVLVTGEPGIGKSRLLQELAATHAEKPQTAVFHCDFQPAEISQPLASFREMVRRLIPQEQYQAIEDPLDAQAISEFLGERNDLADWNNLTPDQKLEVAARAITKAVSGASHDRPSLIVCEDIHWADTIASHLLNHLSEHIGDSRIMLVCSARSTSPVRPIRFTETIELRPLSDKAAAELVGAFLGNEPSLNELKSTLVRETQGNPFHVEECIAALVESGILAETTDHKGYRLQRSLNDFSIPVSLRSALAARVDQLDSADREILLHAAAIGRTFDTKLLETITRQKTPTLATHLTHLQEKGLLRQTRFLPMAEYTFSHNLIHEVTYDTMLRQHRKQLHREILTALEQRDSRGSAENTQRMADHAYRAEEWVRAYLYNRQAAARAQATSQNIEAKGYLSRALYAAEALGSSPQNLRRLAATQLQLVPSLLALGQLSEAGEHLTESLDTASHIGNLRLQSRISSNIALLRWITGDYARAIRADRTALQFARKSRDSDQQVASTVRIGMLFCEAGHYHTAERLLRRGLALIPPEREFEKFGLLGIAAIGARAYLARAYAELGHFRSAITIGVESIDMAMRSSDPFSRAFACLSTAVVLIRQGEFSRALPVVHSGMAICEQARLRLLQPLGQACHAYITWNLGQRRDDARNRLRKAVEHSTTQNLTARRSLFLCWLADIDRLESRQDEAIARASEALALASTSCERGHEAWAHWTLAETLAGAPKSQSGKAIEHFTAARQRAKRHGMRTLVSLCDFGLSRLLAASGKSDDASRYAAQAKTAFDEMGLRAPEDRRIAQPTRDMLPAYSSATP